MHWIIVLHLLICTTITVTPLNVSAIATSRETATGCASNSIKHNLHRFVCSIPVSTYLLVHLKMLIKKENTDLIPLSVLTFFTLFFPNLLFVYFFSGENILKLIFS